MVIFTKAGGDKMRKLSGQLIGKRLAILVDGKVITAPVVKARIGERATVNGLSGREEVERIVRSFKRK